MTVETQVIPILAALAENDGLSVTILDGRIWARSGCAHISEPLQEICHTVHIDALLQRTALCLVEACTARQDALAVQAEMAAIREAR